MTFDPLAPEPEFAVTVRAAAFLMAPRAVEKHANWATVAGRLGIQPDGDEYRQPDRTDGDIAFDHILSSATGKEAKLERDQKRPPEKYRSAATEQQSWHDRIAR